MKLYKKILSKFWFNLGSIFSLIVGILYPIILGLDILYINTIFALVINILSVVLINASISFLNKNEGSDAAIIYRKQAKYNFCGLKIMLFLVIICFIFPFVFFNKNNIIREIALSMYVNGFVIPLLMLFFYISLDEIKEKSDDKKNQNPILCCLKGFLNMFILFFEKDQNNKRPIIKGILGALFIIFLIIIVLIFKILPIFT